MSILKQFSDIYDATLLKEPWFTRCFILYLSPQSILAKANEGVSTSASQKKKKPQSTERLRD